MTGELLQALTACAAAAMAAGQQGRVATLRTLVGSITERSFAQVRTARDRELIRGLQAEFLVACAGLWDDSAREWGKSLS